MNKVSPLSAAPRRPGASKIGRPTKAEAISRQEVLLDAAADLFLELGYDAATMLQIASAAGMTKRTIYSRHQDKAALFSATVQRAIDRMIAGQAELLKSLEGKPVPDVLRTVARMRLGQVTSEIGIKLQRIVNAETRRFPELFRLVGDQVTRPVTTFLTRVLQGAMAEGKLSTTDPKLAATAFLSMAVGAPARIAVSGGRADHATDAQRIDFLVELFLTGLRYKGEGA